MDTIGIFIHVYNPDQVKVLITLLPKSPDSLSHPGWSSGFRV